jgi:hypothetical protein
MYKKTLALSLMLSLNLFLVGCDENAEHDVPSEVIFSEMGLEQYGVEKLVMVNDQLIALTEQGLYRYDTTWTALTETSYNIFDLAVISDTHWIASVKEPLVWAGEIEEEYASFFIETTDAGETWQIIEDNFGGDNFDNEPAFALFYNQQSEKLYATGFDVFASSTDFGQTWSIEEGYWGAISGGLGAILMRDSKQDIWFGGQDANGGPILNQFNFDTYELTMHSQELIEFLSYTGGVSQVLADPKNNERIIVSAFYGIVHTDDSGETWSSFVSEDDDLVHLSPVFDPIDNNTIYTAGWNEEADVKSLLLNVSRDDGITWQSYTFEKEGFEGRVRSLIAVETGGKTELYIGSYQSGVVKVSFD